MNFSAKAKSIPMIIINKIFQIWVQSGMFYYDFKYFMLDMFYTVEYYKSIAMIEGYETPDSCVEFMLELDPKLPTSIIIEKYGTNIRLIPNIETPYIHTPWEDKLEHKLETMFFVAYNNEDGNHYEKLRELYNHVCGCISSYDCCESMPGIGGCRTIDELMELYNKEYEELVNMGETNESS